jgi:hypothetical protein
MTLRIIGPAGHSRGLLAFQWTRGISVPHSAPAAPSRRARLSGAPNPLFFFPIGTTARPPFGAHVELTGLPTPQPSSLPTSTPTPLPLCQLAAAVARAPSRDCRPDADRRRGGLQLACARRPGTACCPAQRCRGRPSPIRPKLASCRPPKLHVSSSLLPLVFIVVR